MKRIVVLSAALVLGIVAGSGVAYSWPRTVLDARDAFGGKLVSSAQGLANAWRLEASDPSHVGPIVTFAALPAGVVASVARDGAVRVGRLASPARTCSAGEVVYDTTAEALKVCKGPGWSNVFPAETDPLSVKKLGAQSMQGPLTISAGGLTASGGISGTSLSASGAVTAGTMVVSPQIAGLDSLTLISGPASSAAAVAVEVNSYISLTHNGARLMEWKNFDAPKAHIAADGAVRVGSIAKASLRNPCAPGELMRDSTVGGLMMCASSGTEWVLVGGLSKHGRCTKSVAVLDAGACEVITCEAPTLATGADHIVATLSGNIDAGFMLQAVWVTVVGQFNARVCNRLRDGTTGAGTVGIAWTWTNQP